MSDERDDGRAVGIRWVMRIGLNPFRGVFGVGWYAIDDEKGEVMATVYKDGGWWRVAIEASLQWSHSGRFIDAATAKRAYVRHRAERLMSAMAGEQDGGKVASSSTGRAQASSQLPPYVKAAYDAWVRQQGQAQQGISGALGGALGGQTK